jgi:restriction system protein
LPKLTAGWATQSSIRSGEDKTGAWIWSCGKTGGGLWCSAYQWQAFSVGAPVVREMFGILTAERADEAIVVTSGRFTAEAQKFARGKSIQLLDGPQLLILIQSVQSRLSEPTSPKCPLCGHQMVVRTARRGRSPGQQFWGCRNYPECRGTAPV